MNESAQPILVAGSWEEGMERLEIRSPFNREVVGVTSQASPEQVERAIAAAVSAMKMLAKLAAAERGQILERVSTAIASERDEFARLIAREAGKPLKAARVEVERAVF